MSVALLSSLAILCLSQAAVAKDIYVRAGSNGNGTKENPYGDPDLALRDAYSGDVIHVAAGLYFGAASSGKWKIAKPNLTMVGGYNKDFTERHPFKHLTRLMQGEDPDPTMCRDSARCKALIERYQVPGYKGSYDGTAMVRGEGDHTGTIIDGFVIDSFTRYRYKPNEDLSLKDGPLGTPAIELSKPGAKVRNCIIVNTGGPGIRINALGTKPDKDELGVMSDDWSEVSNTIIVNTLMESIDLTVGNFDQATAPKGGCALIKNNTLLFDWEMNGHNYNLYQGRQTQLTVIDNIFGFSGYGIGNMFDNRFGRYVGNVFFGHASGAYHYLDAAATKGVLILDDVTQLEGEKCKKQYQCSKQSRGNVNGEPKLKSVDTFFLDKFFNQIASQGGGKVTMDTMTSWRSMLGMPLAGSAGTGKVNFAPVWDPGADLAGLMLFAENLPGKGAQLNGVDGKFQEYQSQTVVAAAKEYQEVQWADLKRAQKMVGPIVAAADKGMSVMVTAKVGDQDMSSYYLPAASGVARDKGWLAFRDESRDILLYVQSGTEAHSLLKQAKQEGAEVIIKGTAYSAGGAGDKIGIKIDAIESTSAD
ncbi:MAG: hypothetical protein HYV63_23575 [Candidatus Schekmanbacteria bacterium]|nr:hypothetical protein [Candidatus Schekmanbacteria bacterium]